MPYHIVAGCKTYLEEGRYTWRHNSALNFLAQSLKAIPNCSLYADLSGYLSPSIITGDSFRPDLLLVISDHRLFILELTVGYETNLDVTANRKREKYSNLIHNLSSAYSSIMFVNLSISSLGIFGLSCSSFIDMCNALDISENHLRFMISATLTSIVLSKNQFGLDLQLPSVKFTQCQTVSRNALRTSPNTNIQALWKNTSSGMNLQYDIYRNTKDVLKAVKSDNRERLAHQLLSQGAIISFLLDNSLKKLNGLWSVVQSNLPTNILNFTIKYLNNTLPTRKN